jgi:hypothetical protein
MKRTQSQPVVLPFPVVDPSPMTIPFRGQAQTGKRGYRLSGRARIPLAGACGTLSPVRARLLRMIIESERVRNDGPRAS